MVSKNTNMCPKCLQSGKKKNSQVHENPGNFNNNYPRVSRKKKEKKSSSFFTAQSSNTSKSQALVMLCSTNRAIM